MIWLIEFGCVKVGRLNCAIHRHISSWEMLFPIYLGHHLVFLRGDGDIIKQWLHNSLICDLTCTVTIKHWLFTDVSRPSEVCWKIIFWIWWPVSLFQSLYQILICKLVMCLVWPPVCLTVIDELYKMFVFLVANNCVIWVIKYLNLFTEEVKIDFWLF